MVSRGLLLYAVAILLVFAAYLYLVWPAAGHWLEAVVPAALGAVGVFTLIGSLRRLARLPGVRSALAQAERGETPRDGALAAVAGAIQAADQPLVAPFTGRPCVAYSYEVVRQLPPHPHSKDRSPRSETFVSGEAMARAQVVGRQGAVALRGFLQLGQMAAEPIGDPATLARARDFVASADFRQVEIAALADSVVELSEAMESGAAARRDWRFQDGVPPDALFYERRLEAGRPVVALGRWRADVPALAGEARQGRLLQWALGDVRDARKTLLGGGLGLVAVGVVVFAVGHFMLAALVGFTWPPLPRAVQDGLKGSMPDLAGQGDLELLRAVLAAGGAPDQLDARGERALCATRDAAVAQVLLEAGAEPDRPCSDGRSPLARAVGAGDASLARQLLDHGAKPDFAEGGDLANTPFMVALRGQDPELLEILRQAGARNPLAHAGNAQPLPADGGAPFATVAAFYAATVVGDKDAILATYRDRDAFSFEHFDAWRIRYANPPRFVRGFANDKLATLRVDGGISTQDVLLEKDPQGKWLIVADWEQGQEWPVD